MTTNNERDGYHVPWCLACPVCGEDDMDKLVWIDDEQVCCNNCGMVYRPGQEGGGHE